MAESRDSVEIIAREMCDNHEHDSAHWEGRACAECTEWAGHLLGRVTHAGWRIVRTEPVRPTWVERDWRIIDEWTPDA